MVLSVVTDFHRDSSLLNVSQSMVSAAALGFSNRGHGGAEESDRGAMELDVRHRQN